MPVPSPTHPSPACRVAAGTPLFGPNRCPDALLKGPLLPYIDDVEALGNTVMEVAALALGLDAQHFWRHVTLGEPLALVRIFSYPPAAAATTSQQQQQPATATEAEAEQPAWGIGEHTDYGLLTLLRSDAPGLQFKHPEHGWVDVPVLPDSFVCNVGASPGCAHCRALGLGPGRPCPACCSPFRTLMWVSPHLHRMPRMDCVYVLSAPPLLRRCPPACPATAPRTRACHVLDPLTNGAGHFSRGLAGLHPLSC